MNELFENDRGAAFSSSRTNAGSMTPLVARIERRDGFTLIELLVVVAVIGLLAALAAPGLLRARMSGNETSAIASLRAIVVAQASYANTCARGAYATMLLNLAVGPGGSPEGFLSPDLGLTPIPIKSGYRFTVLPGAASLAGATDCNGQATRTAYYLTAVPTIAGATGVRGFATNQGGSIWQDVSGTPPVEPFAIGPGVTPVQ